MMSVQLEGFAELAAALEELSTSQGKAVLRRAGLKAGAPLADAMKALAPAQPGSGTLRASIAVSTKLARRQQRLHRKMFRDDRSAVEIFVGPSYDLGHGGRAAHLNEFGTGPRYHKSGKFVGAVSPRPFARPAWDADKGQILGRLARELRVELDRAVARARRRAMKG